MWKVGQCVTINRRKNRIEKISKCCSGFFCDRCELGPCDDKERACLKCTQGCAPVHIYPIRKAQPR